MKLINYDSRYLVYQNLITNNNCQAPKEPSQTQIHILCRIITQKRISKKFFDFITESLFHTTDWKGLSYQQMYELIHVLTHYNYKKEGHSYE